MTPEEAGRAGQAAIFTELSRAIARGWLPREYLLDLHVRLAVYSSEFEPGPALDQMRLAVDDALGIDASLAVPDSPEDEDPPARRDW